MGITGKIRESLYWAERKRLDLPVLDVKAQTEIYEKKLNDKIPFMTGKLGGNELWAMRTCEFGYWDKLDELYENMVTGAGFFYDGDRREGIERFSQCMTDSLSAVDYLIEWQKPKEYYFLKKYKSSIPELITFMGLNDKDPWTRILKGRKVLVIHPFAKSIEYQYERRTEVFRNPDVLPEMDLKVIPAVQTIAGNKDGRFKYWFEALDYMTEEALSKDFDIALVGCGAYGFPLAGRIKKAGHAAMHLGGDLQLLFGIIGKRWENEQWVKNMMTDAWKHPFPDEIPAESDKVEGGCYF